MIPPPEDPPYVQQAAEVAIPESHDGDVTALQDNLLRNVGDALLDPGQEAGLLRSGQPPLLDKV